MTDVQFTVGDETVHVSVKEVLLAGYTGRDQAAVMAHIRELETRTRVFAKPYLSHLVNKKSSRRLRARMLLRSGMATDTAPALRRAVEDV